MSKKRKAIVPQEAVPVRGTFKVSDATLYQGGRSRRLKTGESACRQTSVYNVGRELVSFCKSNPKEEGAVLGVFLSPDGVPSPDGLVIEWSCSRPFRRENLRGYSESDIRTRFELEVAVDEAVADGPRKDVLRRILFVGLGALNYMFHGPGWKAPEEFLASKATPLGVSYPKITIRLHGSNVFLLSKPLLHMYFGAIRDFVDFFSKGYTSTTMLRGCMSVQNALDAIRAGDDAPIRQIAGAVLTSLHEFRPPQSNSPFAERAEWAFLLDTWAGHKPFLADVDTTSYLEVHPSHGAPPAGLNNYKHNLGYGNLLNTWTNNAAGEYMWWESSRSNIYTNPTFARLARDFHAPPKRRR